MKKDHPPTAHFMAEDVRTELAAIGVAIVGFGVGFKAGWMGQDGMQ